MRNLSSHDQTRDLVKLNLTNSKSLASLLLPVLPIFQCVMYGMNVRDTMTTKFQARALNTRHVCSFSSFL